MNTEALIVNATTDENWDTRVEVTVPASEIDQLFNKAERLFMQRAKVPGFRPGKVPANIVRKRFKAEIEYEVQREVVGDSLPAAIEKEGLNPLQMPRLVKDSVTELTRGADFTFAARFDVHPSFEPQAKETIELYKLEADVTDERIDEVLNRLLESGRNYEKAEDAAAAEGDMLKVNYAGVIEGDADEEVPSTAKRLIAADDTWVLLKDPEVLPGISAGLAGVKVGDEKTLDVTFDDDFHEPFLAGKKGSYTFTILEVHQSVLPELNDEFAARYGAESAEKLREMVRDKIAGEARQGHLQVWRNQLEQWLIDQASFTLPAVTLRAETEQLVPQLLQQRIMDDANNDDDHEHGPDCDHDHEHGEDCNHGDEEAEACTEDHEHGPDCNHDHKPNPKVNKLVKEVQEEAAKLAEQRLKLRIVRDAFAQKEGVAVEPKEVQQELYEFMYRNRVSEEELEKRYDVEKLQNALAEDLLTRKLLDRLLETATYVEPPAEEVAEA